MVRPTKSRGVGAREAAAGASARVSGSSELAPAEPARQSKVASSQRTSEARRARDRVRLGSNSEDASPATAQRAQRGDGTSARCIETSISTPEDTSSVHQHDEFELNSNDSDALGKRPLPSSSSSEGSFKRTRREWVEPGVPVDLTLATPSRRGQRSSPTSTGELTSSSLSTLSARSSSLLNRGTVPMAPLLPKGVVDIDAKCRGDAEACTEYLQEIYLWHRQQEHRAEFRPCPAAVAAKQTCFRAMDRTLVFDWMSMLVGRHNMRPETLAMAATLLDRALAVIDLRNALAAESLAAAVLHMAAKTEEIMPPALSDLLSTLSRDLREAEVLRVEAQLCKVLSFRLAAPNVQTFLPRFMAAAQLPAGSRAEQLCHYLAEIAMGSSIELASNAPSLLAAAAVAIARVSTGQTAWDATLHYYTSYGALEVREVASLLEAAHLKCEGGLLKAVWRKYTASTGPRVGYMTCVGVEAIERGLSAAASAERDARGAVAARR